MSASKYAKHVNTRSTPQIEPIPGRNMVQNNGGGYSFAISKWQRLERFLILGSEGGHFNVGEEKLTKENATSVFECITEDPARTVNTIVSISVGGRAPKNGPAIFALALAAGSTSPIARVYALDALPKVCRTFTHLADFLGAVKGLRGWGRGLRTAVAKWYNDKTVEQVAYQMTKYRNRNGYTHRDALRLAHPKAMVRSRRDLYSWAVGKQDFGGTIFPPGSAMGLPSVLDYLNNPESSLSNHSVTRAIRDYKLAHEHVPNHFLSQPSVWEALLQNMGATALIRNLGRMTSIGLLQPLASATREVVARLRSPEYLRDARVHPFALLLAATTYAAGHGVKGNLTWQPVPKITDALNDAFYASFANVEPTGKNIYSAIDCSGSMSWECSKIAGSHITARVGSAAMALVTENVEQNCYVAGFSDDMMPVDISSRMRLDDVVRALDCVPMGGTNCAAPMEDALKRGLDVDAFVVYTDNDTNSGQSEHPKQALDRYRQRTGRAAKLIVVSMASNGHSIADPDDAGMLDISGFDADCPAIISDFIGDKVGF